MANNHQTENPLYKALVKQYQSEIASAVATLIVYFDNPTGDHLKEMDEQVLIISMAEQNLESLNKYFNNTQI